MQAAWNWEMFRQERRFQFPPIGAGTDKSAYHFNLSVPNAKETPPGGKY